MADTGHAEHERSHSANDPDPIAPQHQSARAPSEREIAEQQNDNVQKNRERFIYRPIRFMWQPVRLFVKKLNRNGEAVTAAATFFIAVLTGVLAWYASGQEKIFTQQVADSRAIQRAFVGVKEVAAAPVGKEYRAGTATDNAGEFMYRLGIVWENSGETPTVELSIEGLTSFDRTIPPPFPDFDSPNQDRESNRIHGLILPKGTLHGQQNYVNAEGLDIASAKRLPFYLYGVAKYKDIFGKRHLTIACYNLFPAPIDHTAAPQTEYGTAYREYNCADEDCRRYANEPHMAKLLEFLSQP